MQGDYTATAKPTWLFGDLQTAIGLSCEAKISRSLHFRSAHNGDVPVPVIMMVIPKLTRQFSVRQVRLGLLNARLPER